MLRRKKHRIILVLSCPRSGSTLLEQLLLAHPDIIGCGECWISYEKLKDLDKLISLVYFQLRRVCMHEEWVVDKLAGTFVNGLRISESIFLSPRVSFIFLIREPRGTISSFQASKWFFKDRFSGVDGQIDAVDCYVKCLSKIEEYGKICSRERSLFLTYEQLIDQSDLVFNKLKTFLNLSKPFTADYQKAPKFGVLGLLSPLLWVYRVMKWNRNWPQVALDYLGRRVASGDYSERSRKGKIVRDKQNYGIEISSESYEKSMKAYNKCCDILSSNCSTIADDQNHLSV